MVARAFGHWPSLRRCSAFGGKATSPNALHMSAFDPMRTWWFAPFRPARLSRYDALSEPRGRQ